MSMWPDEFLHQLKHAAAQQLKEYRSFANAHIASYDPATHRVRVLFPSFRDTAGNMTLSPWMPLGTLAVGNGFGIQVAPFGGATAAQPNLGEPVIVEFIERNYGVQVCAHLKFNDVMPPPFPEMKPGEIGIKQKSGSNLYFDADGNIIMTAHKDASTLAVNISRSASQGIAESAQSMTWDIADTATLSAGAMVLAAAGPAVARVGDQVVVDLATGTGTITTGSTKVTSG